MESLERSRARRAEGVRGRRHAAREPEPRGRPRREPARAPGRRRPAIELGGAPARREPARARGRARPAIELAEPRAHRDLTDAELWDWSLRRSRERRELAAAQGFELPARGMSVAALVALTGGPVAGIAVAKVLSSGGSSGQRAPHVRPARAAAPARSAGREAAPAPAASSASLERRATVAAAAAPRAAARPEATSSTRSGPRAKIEATTAKAGAPAGAEAVTQGTGSKPVASSAAANPAQDSAAPGRGGVKRTAGGEGAAKRPAGVRGLQQALGVPADGVFGPATEKALKRWQKRHRLEADGVAGPETRKALGLGEGRVLKRKKRAHRAHHGGRRHAAAGHRARHGGGVRALQRALGLPADGVFGPATEKALKRWQRKHGLAADGVAGPQTRRALGLGPGSVLKRKGHARHGHRRHSGGGGGGGSSSVVQRVIAAANAIATKPYKYGGGHGSWNDSGYDCSGSVSYALHGGGLLSAPVASGGFMSYGASGPGRHITIYANSGHVYMTIDGRRYDTSARYENGSRWSSQGRSGGGYVVRHPPGY
jgi:peptidoglycan hydrolase-like protein with peptidoglycan-binding domain